MALKTPFEDVLMMELKDKAFAFDCILDALEEVSSGETNVQYLVTVLGQAALAHGISNITEKLTDALAKRASM